MLLITGSNMAGKSTFLRTIGLNLVVALRDTLADTVSADVAIVRGASGRFLLTEKD